MKLRGISSVNILCFGISIILKQNGTKVDALFDIISQTLMNIHTKDFR